MKWISPSVKDTDSTTLEKKLCAPSAPRVGVDRGEESKRLIYIEKSKITFLNIKD